MSIKLENKPDNKKFSEITVKSALSTDESYKLCVKADALRLANMFQESIPKYLRSIFYKRENVEAYYGLALSYKALQNYDKAIETLQKALSFEKNDFAIFMNWVFVI